MPPPMIDVINVHKRFGNNRVLTGVNLSVEAKRTCVILGSSGSGKTVLMKHMIGLMKPDQGQVLVEGEDIAPLEGAELTRVRRKFGMVFQAAALFDSMTVFENVAFPLRERRHVTEEECREIVRQKLELLGLKGTEERLPADLSGGMRKRVGLARAIALDPKILLYDEPTTGLDPLTADYVDDMILTAQQELGVTSVVISHDLSSAFKVADHIAFLSAGKIIDQGNPEQLRGSQHPTIKRFLQSWSATN